jgi:hypothetical protein
MIQGVQRNEENEDQPSLPIPDLEDEEEWEIEEAKDKGVIRDQVHYLVKCEGWPTEYNQWILEEDIGNVRLAIQRYEKAKGQG